MKLISKFGNKQYLFGYVDDVIAYTPAVKNFSQLLKQRYRWKYGRFKALFKYKHLMFANDKKYTFNLTWVKLPKIFIEEFVTFMEPFLQLYLAYIVYKYFDLSLVTSILILYTIFGMSTMISEKFKSGREKMILLILSPICYFFLMVINVIDYLSLIKCLIRGKEIIRNTKVECKWEHVDR